MNAECERLLEASLKLPEADRADLAACLYASLECADRVLDAAWEEEIKHRIAAIDRGEGRLIPWAQVRTRMFSNAERRHDPCASV